MAKFRTGISIAGGPSMNRVFSMKALVLLVATVVGAACNGSGMHVPTDGSAGTTGGAGGGGSYPPGCLRDLMAPCSIAGACTYQTDDAGNPTSFCYASGAHSTSMGSRCTTTGPSLETASVSKPDGTLCYTVSISASPSQACENETYTWKDASGATIATGTVFNVS